jgi:hypothetical protein
MKKLLMLLLSVLMTVVLPIPTLAAADDLSGLTNTIVTSVNDLLSDKLSRKVTLNDINYDDAFKVYVGVDVFKMETTNISELKNALEAGGYIYEIPLYIDGDTILVDIAKGQPLNNNAEFTEEERKSILANDGKWQVTAVKYYRNEIVNYATEVGAKIGKVPDGTILVGGLPRFRFAVALLPDENGEIVGLLPLSEIPGVEKLQTFRSADQNFYNYKEIKEYINQLPPANPDEAGGFGFLDVEGPNSNHTITYVAIIVVTILCALTVIFIVYRKKAKIIE